jgi:hypothetical protein
MVRSKSLRLDMAGGEAPGTPLDFASIGEEEPGVPPDPSNDIVLFRVLIAEDGGGGCCVAPADRPRFWELLLRIMASCFATVCKT